MKRKYTRWTPEKVAELKRLHGQGLSLREVSARMGLPRYAAECRYSRLPREEKSPYLSESALKWLDEHYADIPNPEIARKFGVTVGSVWHAANKRGLRKAPGFLSRFHKTLYAKERSRIVWGLPQKTRIRIGRQSGSKAQYRCRLRRYGYVEDAEDRNLYRYGPDLKRHLEVEERAHAKHRIRFLPIEEEPTLDGLYPAVAEELRRQRDGIPVVDHSVPDEPIEMRIEAEGCDVHLDFAVSARVTPDGDGRETPRVTVYQDVQVRWKSPLRVTYWDAEGDETDYDNADELAKLRKFVEEEIQAIIEWE